MGEPLKIQPLKGEAATALEGLSVGALSRLLSVCLPRNGQIVHFGPTPPFDSKMAWQKTNGNNHPVGGLRFFNGSEWFDPSGVVAPIPGTESESESGGSGSGTKGERGDPGPEGGPGAKGEPGAKGDTGERGIPGERGVPGEKGEVGDRGATGAKGDTGEPGQTGPIGPANLGFLGGTEPPTATDGQTGQIYFQQTWPLTLYGPKFANSWGEGFAIGTFGPPIETPSNGVTLAPNQHHYMELSGNKVLTALDPGQGPFQTSADGFAQMLITVKVNGGSAVLLDFSATANFEKTEPHPIPDPAPTAAKMVSLTPGYHKLTLDRIKGVWILKR